DAATVECRGACALVHHASHRLGRVVHGPAGARSGGTLQSLSGRTAVAAGRVGGAVRGLRGVATRVVGRRSAGGAVGVLAAAVSRSTGGAGVAGGPATTASAELSGSD